MSQLANQLVIAEKEEVAQGIRQLLATPLVTERSHPETFDLVRRRREPIRKWFDYYCGWTLTVEPRLGYARLVKVRVAADPGRPARRLRSGRAPFDRRRYVLLCVVAAELLATPVTTVGLLADRVTRASGTDEVVTTFDTASRSERMAFVDVLRLLESYGVLEVIDGSTEAFVDSSDAKVLYQVDATLLLRRCASRSLWLPCRENGDTDLPPVPTTTPRTAPKSSATCGSGTPCSGGSPTIPCSTSTTFPPTNVRISHLPPGASFFAVRLSKVVSCSKSERRACCSSTSTASPPTRDFRTTRAMPRSPRCFCSTR